MKHLLLSLAILIVIFETSAQVGIGTTTPNAKLDVRSSNEISPSNKDGILIPKADAFPATNPTASQDGMLLYVTGDGAQTKGFYYWNNTTTSWVTIASGSLVEKIDDLTDAKSDNDGTNDGSSVFLGVNAGNNDDLTDNRNVGIGYNSMVTNKTGRNNLALGYNSLRFNTTGQSNNALGSFSLFSNTTGNNNTANGFDALYSNTTGFENTGSGAYSLFNNSVGKENTSIGYRSGYSLTNGEGNVFLGFKAGYFETNSDRLYIENSDSASPLIYGEFDNDILRANGELQVSNPSITGYAFPTIDGTAGQILSTDGNGQISWTSSGSGAEKIDDLTDGKSDNDGTNNGSSVYLGVDAGNIDDLTNNQNVGIGYQALSRNTSGSQNLGIGYQSLKNNLTGVSNIGMGPGVLYTNTTGGGNIGLGNSTLYANTSGGDNVAIGYAALSKNTTGSNNIALGYQTMWKNTIGINNIALGRHVLFNNTSGWYNISSGFEALYSNTTGSRNIAFGYRTLYFNNGDDNIATGHGALLANTTGNRNIGTGISSLQSNTTGNDNLALGYQPLNRNETGNNNIAIGNFALADNVGGSNNVAVGISAGGYTGSSNDKSGGVFIGFRAGQSELNDNKLYIENSNSTTPLLYGDFSSDELGINWDSAVALPNTLSVNGNASKTTAGSWLANSDKRLKKDITYMNSELMLNQILKMKGATYYWNDNKTGLERPTNIQYGFIAQDLQKVWPTKVAPDKQGYLQTAYGDYDPMFVEAIKALNNKIESLELENKRYKTVNESFKVKIDNQSAELESLRSDINEIKDLLKNNSN